jgi:glutamate-1-semialdehyde 2,1-aminomutase
MRRFRDDRPADICFARGTFNSHPYVMTCMREFLTRIAQPQYQDCYARADSLWHERVESLNAQLAAAQLPLRLAHMHSILTILFKQPSRYNWMLQFYLRAEGLELSWTGSGRLIMSLDYSDADFAEVAARFVRAAAQMQADGWWWSAPHLSNRWIKRQMLKDMLGARWRGWRSPPAPATQPAPAMQLKDVH